MACNTGKLVSTGLQETESLLNLLQFKAAPVIAAMGKSQQDTLFFFCNAVAAKATVARLCIYSN